MNQWGLENLMILMIRLNAKNCKRCLSPTVPLMPCHPPNGHFSLISDQGKLRSQPEEMTAQKTAQVSKHEVERAQGHDHPGWTGQGHLVQKVQKGEVQRGGLVLISNKLFPPPLPPPASTPPSLPALCGALKITDHQGNSAWVSRTPRSWTGAHFLCPPCPDIPAEFEPIKKTPATGVGGTK